MKKGIFRVLILLMFSLTITGNTTANDIASSNPLSSASSDEINQILANSADDLRAYRFTVILPTEKSICWDM